MLKRTILVGVAITSIFFPNYADAQSVDWGEEAVWETIGETHGLKRSTRAAIYDDQNVRASIRRVGVSDACSIIEDSIDRVAHESSDAFRAIVIPKVRAMLPAEPSAVERFSVSPNGNRFGRLMQRLERESPQVFTDTHSDALDAISHALGNLPTTEELDWRGAFSDWDFEGPNDTIWDSACMISTSSDPENAKLAFDRFYVSLGS